MKPQSFITLEFLQRATDPRTPLSERDTLQETLAFALADVRELPDWLIEALADCESQIPENIILWLADLLNNYSPIESLRLLELLGKIWHLAAGNIARFRLLEALIESRPESVTAEISENPVLAGLCRDGVVACIKEHDSIELIRLADLVLTTSSPTLIQQFPETLIEYRASDFLMHLRNHIREHWDLMSDQAQRASIWVFEGNSR